MQQLWVQANVYAKFILVLAFVLPVSTMILFYKIEKMFPHKKKAPNGCNQIGAHKNIFTVIISL